MASLPEYLTEQTEEDILSTMLSRVPPDIDKSEGSFIWDSLSPAAYQLFLASGWAQEVLRRGFASTTFGSYLDLRCEEHGITRLPAVKASGFVKFVGDPGTNVPSGQIVTTPADPVSGSPAIEFVVTAPVMLGTTGEAVAPIEAVEPGIGGNVMANIINVMATPIPGIATVSNPAALDGGMDVESDEALLARFLVRVRSPSAGGNKADYINWALEVSGVGAAIVVPLWNGPGTVKVVILGTDKKPASSALVNDVQEHISPTPGLGEGKAPIGALVTVAAAKAINIDVTAAIVLSSGASLAAVTAAFQSTIDEYLKNIAFSSDPSVKFVRIGSMLLDTPGVSDYSALLVNGDTNNVTVDTGEVAIRRTVTLS